MPNLKWRGKKKTCLPGHGPPLSMPMICSESVESPAALVFLVFFPFSSFSFFSFFFYFIISFSPLSLLFSSLFLRYIRIHMEWELMVVMVVVNVDVDVESWYDPACFQACAGNQTSSIDSSVEVTGAQKRYHVPLAQPVGPLNQVVCLIAAKAPVRYAWESSTLARKSLFISCVCVFLTVAMWVFNLTIRVFCFETHSLSEEKKLQKEKKEGKIKKKFGKGKKGELSNSRRYADLSTCSYESTTTFFETLGPLRTAAPCSLSRATLPTTLLSYCFSRLLGRPMRQ